MSSKMDQYFESDSNEMSRTKRNKSVYSSLDIGDLSRIKTNNNVSVISNTTKEIDLEKIKKYIYAMDSQEVSNRRRVTIELPEEKEEVVREEETKDYDINRVLEQAKGTRESDYTEERNRKLSETQYAILNKIKIEPEKDYDRMESIDDLNTEEKTIVDLINDISKTKATKKEDLFADLMGDVNNTVVMAPITDEVNVNSIKNELENLTRDLDTVMKPLDDDTQDLLLEREKNKKELAENLDFSLSSHEKTKKTSEAEKPVVQSGKISEIDKSFFTNSLSFNKKDFEEVEETLEDDDEDEEAGSIFTKIAIGFVIIVLLFTIVFILNLVLDLGLF